MRPAWRLVWPRCWGFKVNAPLGPGGRWQEWTVLQVLAWGRAGGLYRVIRGDDRRILKEIIVPESHPERLPQVLEAVAGWRQLTLPQAIEIEQVVALDHHIWLLMPELSGQPFSLARARAPERVLLQWAEQLCDLVLVLQERQNPLALALLEPDHIMLGERQELIVFNPGWSALASSRPALSTSQGLRKFARLLLFCATGAAPGPRLPPDLPPTILWLVGRCLEDEYTSFTQVRQSLSRPPLEVVEAPPALPPSRPARFLRRRHWIGLALLALLAMLGLLRGLSTRPFQVSPPSVLALVSGQQLVWLSTQGDRLAEDQLHVPIRCLLASQEGELVVLGLDGRSGLTLVGRTSHKVETLPAGGTPLQLRLSNDGRRMVAWLDNGRLGHWLLGGGKVRFLGEVSPARSAPGGQLRAVRGDGAVLMSLPGQGLLLMDAQGAVQATRGDLDDGLFVDQLVVASDSRRGVLLALQGDLQTISRQELPAAADLYRDAYRRQLWGVEADGVVRLWSLPGLNPLGQLRLPARAPLAVAPDLLGHLWILAENGELYLVDSQPLGCRLMGRPGRGGALVSLSPGF